MDLERRPEKQCDRCGTTINPESELCADCMRSTMLNFGEKLARRRRYKPAWASEIKIPNFTKD